MRILTKKLITPLCLAIVTLCLVFGAAGAFVAKKADGDTEWKYPYIYFYEVWKDVPLQVLAYDLANDPNLYGKKLDDLLEGTKEGFEKAANALSAKIDKLNMTFHVTDSTDGTELVNKLSETFKGLTAEVNDGSGTSLYKTKLIDSLEEVYENLLARHGFAEQATQTASALADSDADYGRQLDAPLAEFRDAVIRELEDKDLAEEREYLDKAFYMASDLPADDASALWKGTPLLPLAYDSEEEDPVSYGKKLDEFLKGTKEGFQKAAGELSAKIDELNRTFPVTDDTDLINKIDGTFKDLEEEVNDGPGTDLYKTKLTDSLKELNEALQAQRSVAEQPPQSAAEPADDDTEYGKQLDALLAEFRDAVNREIEATLDPSADAVSALWRSTPLLLFAYDMAKDPNLYGNKLDELLEGTKAGLEKATEDLFAKVYAMTSDETFQELLKATFTDLVTEVIGGPSTDLYKSKIVASLNESYQFLQPQRSVAARASKSAVSIPSVSIPERQPGYTRPLDGPLAEFYDAVKLELEDEELAEGRAYLDKVYSIASNLSTSEDVSALWYATLLPAAFGMVIAAAFLIGEIVFLVLLCRKIWLKGFEGSEKFAVKTGLAAYLTYLASSCTLLMIGKAVIPAMGGRPLSFSPAAFAPGIAVSFSPVTIVGLILGALLCGALFFGKYLSDEHVPGQSRPASRTISQVCQIILFAVNLILINLPIFKLNGVGNVGFFESFILFCIEPKYDSLEMFLALFGFVGSVVLIVACAKGIYNHVYDLLYGETGLGAGKVSPAMNILSVVLSCLAVLTALAFFGVFGKAYGILVPSREEFPLSVITYLPILLCVIAVANLLVSIFAEKLKKN